MPQARGTQTTSALVEEATYKTTPVTPAGQKLYLTANTVQAQQNRLDSNTLAASRERDQPIAGNINVSGSLDFEIGAEWIGTLMKHILGTNATTGANPYTHTMELGDLPVGMIIEKDFGSNISGNRYQYFNGCRVASAQFEFPQEGFPTGSVAIVGAKETNDSSPLDASLDDNGNTPFSAFDASIEEGGSSIAIVTQASINVNNGLDESTFVIGGAGERSALPEGFATVTGSLTALFESTTLLDKAINGTESSLKITLSRGTGLGSAGNESIEFFVQQLLYERVSPPITGPAGILVTLPFKSYLNSDGVTSALQVTIKNAVATV
jgi:hypothetical protein